jgi:hypothetical protein
MPTSHLYFTCISERAKMLTMHLNNKTFMNKEIYVAHLDTQIDLSVFFAVQYILFFDIRYFDYD